MTDDKFLKTNLFALLRTSFWFAFIRIDDGDSCNFVRHGGGDEERRKFRVQRQKLGTGFVAGKLHNAEFSQN